MKNIYSYVRHKSYREAQRETSEFLFRQETSEGEFRHELTMPATPFSYALIEMIRAGLNEK